MGQTSVERLHERLDVLRTSFPPPPSWIQDGDAGNDVIQNLGRVFRSLLWRWRKMAALPLPVAILDDLESEMRSSKMATGSGRAAIFLHLHNRDRKTRPILLWEWTTNVARSVICSDSCREVWLTSRGKVTKKFSCLMKFSNRMVKYQGDNRLPLAN